MRYCRRCKRSIPLPMWTSRSNHFVPADDMPAITVKQAVPDTNDNKLVKIITTMYAEFELCKEEGTIC